jgi:acyl dehydratase
VRGWVFDEEFVLCYVRGVKELETGRRFEWSRSFTEEDILSFAELSGDKGRHHLERDEQGRLLAHGLLTATLPTKLGGDLDYVARKMIFEFLKPVFAGDELRCEGRIDSLIRKPGRMKARLSFEVTNQRGELVLKGETTGVIYDEAR